MLADSRRCPYCNQSFTPSIFHPNQRVCSARGCQKRRRTEHHRQKYRADPEYRLVCRESDQKWRSRNPDYQRRYRQRHPAYVEHNRRAQKRRDRRRRVRDLVKNNLALDLKSLSADIWLAGPDLQDLVKNNLAISEVMIFQTVAASRAGPG